MYSIKTNDEIMIYYVLHLNQQNRTRSGTAQTNYLAPPLSSSHGPTTCGKTRWGRVRSHMGGSEGGVSTDQTQAAEAGSGDVECHLAVGKGTRACEGGGAL